MPASVREIILMLRAHNHADRALSEFAKDVRHAGRAVRLAQLEAEKAAENAVLTQNKLNEATARSEIRNMANAEAAAKAALAVRQLDEQQQRLVISTLQNEKAALRNEIALQKMADSTDDVIQMLKLEMLAIDDQIQGKRAFLIASEKQTARDKESIRVLSDNIIAKRDDILLMEKQSIEIKKRIALLDDESRGIKNVIKQLKLTDEFQRLGAKHSDTFFSALFKPNAGVVSALRSGIPAVLGSPIGIAAGVLALLWVTSFVSAVLASGALGLIAVAIGGLGALALKENEKLKAAFEGTGKFIMEGLAKVAEPMLQSFLGALEIIRIAAGERILPELAKLIYGIGHVIDDVAVMVTFAIEAFLKPLNNPKALKGFLDFIIGIGPHVQRLGKVVGDFFGILMANGHVISQAFGVVVSTIEFFAKVLAFVLVYGSGILVAFGQLWNMTWGAIKDAIEKVIEPIMKFGGVLGPLVDLMQNARNKTGEYKQEVKDLPPELQTLLQNIQGMGNGLSNLNNTATETALKFENVKQKAQSLFEQFMSVDQATAHATVTILGLKDALDKNGLELNENTVAGAKNREQILQAVNAAEQQRQKMIESGASVSYANRVYQENIDKIYNQATAFGVNKKALEEFLNKYRDLANSPNIHKQIIVTGEMRGNDAVFRMAGSSLKFFAKGGKIAAKQAAIVGEEGPELFIPDVGGKIVSNQRLRSFGSESSMAGAGKTITNNFYITTQEIDPKMHAAKLGWELEGRL